MDVKGVAGYFIGYQDNVKGFKIWFPEENTITTGRDVRFTGRANPVNPKRDADHDKFLVHLPNLDEDPSEGDSDEEGDLPEEEDDRRIEEEVPENEENLPAAEEDDLEIEEPENREEDLPVNRRNVDDPQVAVDVPAPRLLRDRTRLRRPEYLNNYVDGNVDIEDLFLAENQEPRSYRDAIQSDEARNWKDAMAEEMFSLKRNKVWELVNLPKGKTTVQNRWTYKVKRDANDNVLRYKARLVAKGYSQREGIDYKETFSPVARYDSIRIILSIAAQEKLILRQFDINTAFLNGEIEETIFMKQPEGFSDGTNRVCKLLKSLYGLKQSSRCWNIRFTNFLEKHKLKATQADPCIFISEGEERIILAIYIDDGLIAAQNQYSINELLAELTKEFEITHGKIDLFLGLQIEKNPDDSIFLHQSAYTKRIIERFRMSDTNPVTIPADPHGELSVQAHPAEAEALTNAPYREAVGCLMYLSTRTRPDIALAVNRVSRHVEKPTKLHWNAVKRILKYLKGTSDYGLTFRRSNDTYLKAFSDADYAGELESRRSTTGYIVLWGSNIITWNTQRQKVVALSTTDAEYMAACQAVKEVVWLKNLIGELNAKLPLNITLLVDSQSAIQLVKNPVFHSRTKHIDVRFHYIRERYQEKLFNLEYINTKDQLADILTKPLVRQLFQHHRQFICSKKQEDRVFTRSSGSVK